MLVSTLAALALFAAQDAGPASAAPASEAKVETKSVEAKEASKKVCYTVTPSASRLPKRVCTKVKEPAAAEKAPETKAE